LHHAHDLGVNPDHHPFRYADNIVYACRDVSVGLQALEQSRQLLEQAGFTLKSEDGPPVDLQRGEQAQLLGFTLRKKGDGLSFALGSSAWAKLKENLKKAHQTADPSRAASQTVAGWIDSAGPAYESKADHALNRIMDTAAQLGFREISSPRELEAQWQLSWKRWCALREKTHRAALQGEGVLAPDGAGGCRLPA
jgi:hypothetical protein